MTEIQNSVAYQGLKESITQAMIGRSQTLQCQFGNISGPEGLKQKHLEMFHYKLDFQDHLENVVRFRQSLFLVGPMMISPIGSKVLVTLIEIR